MVRNPSCTRAPLLHRVVSSAGLLLLACLGAACGADAGTAPIGPGRHPAYVEIDHVSVPLEVGDSVHLMARLLDQHGTPFLPLPDGYALQWESSAPAVASVTADGVVRGLSPGRADIRATAGPLRAIAHAAVGPPTGTLAGTVTLSSDPQPVFSRTGASSGRIRTPAPAAQAPRTLIVTYRAAGPALAGDARGREGAARVAAAVRGRAARRLAGTRARVSTVIPGLRAARVVLPASGGMGEARARLLADPTVARVEAEALVTADQVEVPGGRLPSDPGHPAQAWHYRAVDLPAAWRVTTGAASVVVAVVDDGVRFDHPELAPALTADGFDFVSSGLPVRLCGGGEVDNALDGDGWDADPTAPGAFVLRDGCVEPLSFGGHGTHVAGIVGGAEGNGIGGTGAAWAVRLRPVRVLGAGGGTAFDVAAGIVYAAGLPVEVAPGTWVRAAGGRAQVINASLGSRAGGDLLCAAVTAATAAGALVVASAGNDASAEARYPAACEDAVAVAAVGPDLAPAAYSNHGPAIDVAAPGGDPARGEDAGVLSTAWDFAADRPGFALLHGTSMAAPHVSGIAALVAARSPGLTPAMLRARLTAVAVDLGAPGRDDRYGAGLVNARNAVTGTHAAARALAVHVYDARTGALVRTAPVSPGGGFVVRRLPPGSYWVAAGEDEGGDAVFGVPGAGMRPRRWGAHATNGRAAVVEVRAGAVAEAAVTVGAPYEAEPNGAPALAGRLLAGGYVSGAIDPADDVDVYAVVHPGGAAAFETTGRVGSCGFAGDADTVLRLYDAAGTLLAENDDAGPGALHRCSRITRTLPPGTYLVAVSGRGAGGYALQAR